MMKKKKQAIISLMDNKDFQEVILKFIDEAKEIALSEDIDDFKVRDELVSRRILKYYIENLMI